MFCTGMLCPTNSFLFTKSMFAWPTKNPIEAMLVAWLYSLPTYVQFFYVYVHLLAKSSQFPSVV